MKSAKSLTNTSGKCVYGSLLIQEQVPAPVKKNLNFA
jgi:hypothetical protein